MDNVTHLHEVTNQDLDPDKVLEMWKGEMDKVFILGIAKDGTEVIASSVADPQEMLWYLESAKHAIMREFYG